MVDLPAPDRPVNHTTHGLLALDGARARSCSTSIACQWTFCGAAQREVEHAGADRGVGEPVDEDEAADVAVVA